jgi:pyoverdine/dityrosine biosynthesis protein Dit1
VTNANHVPEQARAQRSRLRVLEAALALFARDGYEATTFQKIATEASVSVGLACRYFPTKEHLVVAAYDRLATALEAWTVEMPVGTVAERFEATMDRKLALLAPLRRSMTALAARAIDPTGRASVLGPATEVVRSKVAGVFWVAVTGATDAPPAPEAAARLARMLYGAHLLLVLLYIQEEDARGPRTRDAVDLVCTGLALQRVALGFLAGPLGARLDGLLGGGLGTSRALAPSETARLVVERIFRRRRVLPGVSAEPTEAARLLHLGRVQSFIDAGEPIQLVLPAFPAKAPNLRKVLGKLPDSAESVALASLDELLAEIQEAYAPGADLVICSDGHVFADLVGVADADVRSYRAALEEMIAELGTHRIRVFDLEDAFGAVKPAQARALLLASYAETEEEIRARAARSEAHEAQLDGIHRLLFEDEVVRHPEASRTQARKVTRARAYEVVRRSDAWGGLVATAYPRAVRLSIHPQPDVSPKIGIALLPTEDAWLTPWHGVALFDGERARLVHRADAEAAGARVVMEDGRPSYMEKTA